MQNHPEAIGRYRIVGKLGHGGFATVYLGEDQGLNDLVAIKVLAEAHSYDPEHVERFVAEARVMRNLKAPGVVTVHDVGEYNGQPYFVMEYCKLGTLSNRLVSLGRPLTIDEGVGLAQAISRAMRGLHSAAPPVVHRDIKPENLLIRDHPGTTQPAFGGLLNPNEELIVGDFGLAKVVDLNSTKLSILAYTQGFAPPEQIRGESAVEPSTDVYSASAVVVAAISDEGPQQVFSREDRAFSAEALAATGPLQPVLERGLAFDRHQRHGTIMELADALTTTWRRAPTNATPLQSPAYGQAAQQSPTPPQPQAYPAPAPPPQVPPNPAVMQPPPSPYPVPASELPDADVRDATIMPPNYATPPGGAQIVGPTNQVPVAPTMQQPSSELSAAAPPLQSPASPSPSQTGKGRKLGLIGALAGILVIAALAAAFMLRPNTSAIVGPTESIIGDAVAFTVPDASDVEWRVNKGDAGSDSVLGLQPSSVGTVEIIALVGAEEEKLSLEVKEASSEARIVGPAHLRLNEVTELSIDGMDTSELTWTVDDSRKSASKTAPTLSLAPRTAGTVQVTATANGQSVTRTFTVAP